MPRHEFALDGDGSPIIAVWQEGDGADVTVLLDDRILGILTTPEEMSAGRVFVLDVATIITVKVVDQQVQVLRNGLPLSEVSPKTTASPAPIAPKTLTKRVMLLCATIATLIVMIGLLLLVSNRYETANPATEICFFRCIPGPIAPILAPISCGLHGCPTPPVVVTPSPGAPAPVLPDAVLLGGWVLPLLVAFLVGLRDAFARRSWGWVAFGLLPALLLEIALLVYALSPLSQMRFSQDVTLYLLGPSYAIVFLAPAICLLYASSLEA